MLGYNGNYAPRPPASGAFQCHQPFSFLAARAEDEACPRREQQRRRRQGRLLQAAADMNKSAIAVAKTVKRVISRPPCPLGLSACSSRSSLRRRLRTGYRNPSALSLAIKASWESVPFMELHAPHRS